MCGRLRIILELIMVYLTYLLRFLVVGLVVVGSNFKSGSGFAGDAIKIGILHSLSGTMAIPATDYYLDELGVEKFALLGTDYVYPRTTNKILEQYLKDKGISESDIFVNYTPFGHSDWSKIVADVVALGAQGKKVGVISTINGDANIGFYKELAAAGVSADDIPVIAFSVGEEELSGLDTTNLVGHLAAWNYFQFDIISQTEEVPGDAWTNFLPESAVLVSDWQILGCGMYNTETKSCVQIKSIY